MVKNQLQIELKEKEVEQIRKKLDEIIQIKNISNEIKNADTFNQEEIKYILEDINTIKQKSQIKEQKEGQRDKKVSRSFQYFQCSSVKNNR